MSSVVYTGDHLRGNAIGKSCITLFLNDYIYEQLIVKYKKSNAS